MRQGEEFLKHVADFKEILGADEDFASRLSSVMGVECTLGRQVAPMGASAPVSVVSAQAAASVPATNVVLGPAGLPACSSAVD